MSIVVFEIIIGVSLPTMPQLAYMTQQIQQLLTYSEANCLTKSREFLQTPKSDILHVYKDHMKGLRQTLLAE